MARSSKLFTGNYTAKAYAAHPGRNPQHYPGGKTRLEFVTTRIDGKDQRVVSPVDRSRWRAHRGAKEMGVNR